MLKRKLAALLAGAMILTSLPMVSFAKTNNGIDRVPVVKDDVTFTWDNAPVLRIKADPNAIDTQTFQLKFENADWKGYDTKPEYGEHPVVDSTLYDGVSGYTYRKITDKIVEIRINGSATSVSGDQFIEVPLRVEMGDAGEAKVTVDPMDSTISAGTYVFAVAGSGDTITSIEKANTITSGDKIKPIQITESKIGVFDAGKDQEIELRLPNNFEWDLSSARVAFSGGLAGKATPASPVPTIKSSSDGKIALLNVSFAGSRSERGSIIISDLKIKANNRAKYGDVTVKVSGENVTSETITVANYVDYQSTVKADGDPKEIFAGRYEGVTLSGTPSFDFEDAHKLQKLVIEEDVKNSWLSERTTTIEFPSWVRILGYEVNKEDKITTTLDKNDGNKYDAILDNNADENEVSFTAPGDGSGDKRKLEITFYVSVEGDAEGDITATVSGRSLGEEYEVVLGKAVAPIEVEVDPVDVRIGRQNEVLGDITITEAKEGSIQDRGDIVIELPKDFEWTEAPDVEVTEGDLEIDAKNVKVDDRFLTIPVKTDSRDASTIVISNASVDLDRTIPEGKFELKVGGDALVDNDSQASGADREGKFKTDYIAKVEFASVVTPNVDDLAQAKISGQKASFTVGSADYTVGTEVATADAAPYIKDGRTMIPVKYAAYALGVDPSNIKWDQATKTATILGDRVIQVKIGSKDLVVNGAVLTMDVAAEVVDGRTYLPISWVASALNVPYSWDDATKTVTFN